MKLNASILDKVNNREQDVFYGCKLDPDGVRRLNFPGLAKINEKVGAFAWALYASGGLSAYEMRGVSTEEYAEAVNPPSPVVRRTIGLGINSVAVCATVLVMRNYNIDPLQPVVEFLANRLHSSNEQ